MSGHKAAVLRQLLTQGRLVTVVGAHDGLTAKLVERHGFDAIWASSFGISTSAGVPDASVLTMTEFLSVAAEMNDVVDIPVIADCDCGFGDPVIVQRMAHKYCAAGIAAVCIEDKPFPKTNSFIPGHQRLAAIDDFAAKIRAAVDGREDEDLLVIARTEAFIADCGLDEALRRADAYAEAGADAILIHSKSGTPQQVFDFLHSWGGTLPVVAIPTTYSQVTQEQLSEAGVAMVIYANQTIRASVRAMDELLDRLRRDHSTERLEPQIAPMQELFELSGMNEVRRAR